jgi:pyrroloquinoline quinone biosynthesis protein B
MAALDDLGVQRKMFIHINNTNPVLLEDSAERAVAERAGWTIAHDGMELTL